MIETKQQQMDRLDAEVVALERTQRLVTRIQIIGTVLLMIGSVFYIFFTSSKPSEVIDFVLFPCLIIVLGLICVSINVFLGDVKFRTRNKLIDIKWSKK